MNGNNIKIHLVIIALLSLYLFDGCSRQEGYTETENSYFGQAKPGKIAEKFAPDILSPDPGLYVRSITFTPDGREAYWPVIDRDDDYKRWIVSSKIKDGKWTTPAIASFSQKGYEDDVPCISPDGETMVFISRRPYQPDENIGKENIWIMKRYADKWSKPVPLPSLINSLENIHQQLSIDQQGNLFFSCETDDGYGSLDIYCSMYVNGEFLKPFNLGPIINTEVGEFAPFISPEGDYLIFTKIMPGGWTLYISFNRNNSWDKPIEIDTSLDDFEGINLSGAYITRDGKYLIFFANKENKSIPYWIDTSFIEELRPLE